MDAEIDRLGKIHKFTDEEGECFKSRGEMWDGSTLRPDLVLVGRLYCSKPCNYDSLF